MFSLVLSIVSIALVALLVLAAVYYGGGALSKAGSRAEATKLLSQSTQVLGAAELFYTDNQRWPDSIDEMVLNEYLLESPIQYRASSSLTNAVLAAWNLPAVQAAEEELNGSEGPHGNEEATGKNEVVPWAAPSKGNPTYWVYKAIAQEVCRELNRMARGDDGVYAGIVPGLVTQCFGVKAPYTVVTTREASSEYWKMFVEEWNGADDIHISKDFEWSITPSEEVRHPIGPSVPGEHHTSNGSTNGEYFGGAIVISHNGQNTNSPEFGSVGEGGRTSITIIGNGNVVLEGVKANNGFNATLLCPVPTTLADGQTCTIEIKFPSKTTCTDMSGIISLTTSQGTALITNSARVCPEESNDNVSVGLGSTKQPADTVYQWWFKDTHIGESSVKNVRIGNPGKSPLSIESATLGVKPPFSIANNDCPSLLWPGSSCILTLRFSPTVVSKYGNNSYPLTLVNQTGTSTYYLNGNALAAKTTGYSVYPNPLVIAPAYATGNYTGTVTVRNMGSERMYIDKIPELDGDAAFTIKNSNCNGSGLSINQSCYVIVEVAPQNIGIIEANLGFSLEEQGEETIKIIADAQPPFAMLGGTLAKGFPRGAYKSPDMSSYIKWKSNSSFDKSLMSIDALSLPQGLRYNPDSGLIEGTLPANVVPGDYNITLVAKYNDFEVSSNLVLPITEPGEGTVWSYGNKITDQHIISEIDLTKSLNATDYHVVMENHLFKSGATAIGRFILSGNNPLLKISSVYYIEEDGKVYNCQATIAADGLSASACTIPYAGTTKGIQVRLSMPAIKDSPPVGDIQARLKFIPEATSPVLAPASDFVVAMNSKYQQTVKLTLGQGANAAPLGGQLDFGKFGISSGQGASKLIFLRGLEPYGRLSGAWEIEGSSQFKITNNGRVNKEEHLDACPAASCTANHATEHYMDLYTTVTFSPPVDTSVSSTTSTATLKFVPHGNLPLVWLTPESIILNAESLYRKTAVITNIASSGNTVQDAAAAVYNMGTLGANSGHKATVSYALRGGSEYGRLKGKWLLTGDSNFSIETVTTTRTNLPATSSIACVPGNRVSLQEYNCAARYGHGSRTYTDQFITVNYSASNMSEEGQLVHSAKLEFIPDQDSPVEALAPLEIKLNASTKLSQTIALSATAGNRAENYIGKEVNLGTVTVGSGAKLLKTIYIKTSTLHGKVSGTWSVLGSNNFEVLNVSLSRTTLADSGMACQAPSASNKALRVYQCTGVYPTGNRSNADLAIQLRYTAPLVGDAESFEEAAIVTFTPDAAYPVTPVTPLETTLKVTVKN